MILSASTPWALRAFSGQNRSHWTSTTVINGLRTKRKERNLFRAKKMSKKIKEKKVINISKHAKQRTNY